MQHILIFESQHGISSPSEKLITVPIIFFATIVISTVQFDNYLCLMTAEIDDVSINGVLFSEL
jgi:hypothetical protein